MGLFMASCVASPASAIIVGSLASDNINENLTSSSNPLPVAVLAYSGTPLGFSQITPTTAVTLSAPATSRYCYVMTETNSVRWRDDGTNPTASVGFLLPVNTQMVVTNLSVFKIIQTAVSATVDVSCYK